MLLEPNSVKKLQQSSDEGLNEKEKAVNYSSTFVLVLLYIDSRPLSYLLCRACDSYEDFKTAKKPRTTKKRSSPTLEPLPSPSIE